MQQQRYYGDQGRYPVEQASPDERYTNWLLEQKEEFTMWGVLLRRSYLRGQEDLEAQINMVSIGCALWTELFPKIQGTHLADDFKKWMPMVAEPRLFLNERFASCIWGFEAHIRMAFEHLGITKLM